MAVKALEIHPSALAELKSALGWYLERNKTAALKFAAELDRGIGLVVAEPRRWPKGEHDSRKFVLRRFPFAIIYREKQGSIQVLAVAHGHRRPGYWMDRLRMDRL
jgi:plasmid stabilization system protein ParE